MRISNDHINQSNVSSTPLTPPSSGNPDISSVPRLEIGEIEVEPFSTKFEDLFDGLGLTTPLDPPPQECEVVGSYDMTYDVENFTDISDLIHDWGHHEIEEIMVLSPKRPKALSVIHEDRSEYPLHSPTASLSDFEFEFDAFDKPPAKDPMRNATICIRRDSKKQYVIKRKRAARNSPWSEQTILEILTNSDLPFVSWVRWSFHSGEHIYIVTDHFPNGDLMDLIKKNGPLGSHQAIFYASELVAALSSLHAMGIAHRNLEPQNISLDSAGHLVVTNFCRAEFVSQTTVLKQRDVNVSELDSEVMSYRSPEILLGWAYDLAVDCWSFGMLLYFMMFGTHPFGGPEDAAESGVRLYDRILHNSVPNESLRLVHPMARDLIMKCLERNPALRWDIERIKSHPYFITVDWSKVSSMKIEVPSSGSPQPAKQSSVPIPENYRRPISLAPSFLDDNRQQNLSADLNSHQAHFGSETSPTNLFQDPVHLLDLFKPLPRVLDIVQEDEQLSISGTAGHRAEITCQPPSDEATAAERISKFWADIDKEDQGSAASVHSLEFGVSNGIPYNNAPKLRKHRSALQARNRLFNLSTTSFHNKLRKKPRSTGALREPQKVEVIENLPMGVHQIGSGIGFTYNVPTGVPSKISIGSFAPSCHLFHRGFSAFNLGLGLGSSSGNKTKAISVNPPASLPPTFNNPMSGQETLHQDPRPREAGNATFIRDMYRSPSWIVAPPESLPSPLALVNVDSPASAMEPLTPATLVESADDEDCHINIVIPKNLELELDFPYSQWAPGSTLRLVPQTSSECKLPLVDSGNNSFCTLATSA